MGEGIFNRRTRRQQSFCSVAEACNLGLLVEYLLGQNDAVDMTSKTHGKKTFRYYVSQLLYLPVGLAGMLLAFFGGITAANYCHIHSEVVKGLFVLPEYV